MEHAHTGPLGRLCRGPLLGFGLLVSLGCSDDGDGSYPFGADAGQPMTTVARGTEGDSSGGDAESTASGGSTPGTDGSGANETTVGADGPADTTAGADATGDPDTAGDASDSIGSTSDDGDSTTAGTTTSTDPTTGDDGMGDPGVQPGVGMYSECSMFDACAPLVDPICLSTGPVFGFCTVACNVSNECDAPPGETTTAVCDAATGYCMLDCSGGACPTGLDCVVGDLGGGVVSRCLEQ